VSRHARSTCGLPPSRPGPVARDHHRGRQGSRRSAPVASRPPPGPTTRGRRDARPTRRLAPARTSLARPRSGSSTPGQPTVSCLGHRTIERPATPRSNRRRVRVALTTPSPWGHRVLQGRTARRRSRATASCSNWTPRPRRARRPRDLRERTAPTVVSTSNADRCGRLPAPLPPPPPAALGGAPHVCLRPKVTPGRRTPAAAWTERLFDIRPHRAAWHAPRRPENSQERATERVRAGQTRLSCPPPGSARPRAGEIPRFARQDGASTVVVRLGSARRPPPGIERRHLSPTHDARRGSARPHVVRERTSSAWSHPTSFSPDEARAPRRPSDPPARRARSHQRRIVRVHGRAQSTQRCNAPASRPPGAASERPRRRHSRLPGSRGSRAPADHSAGPPSRSSRSPARRVRLRPRREVHVRARRRFHVEPRPERRGPGQRPGPSSCREGAPFNRAR
jgi:hypothetical protein